MQYARAINAQNCFNRDSIIKNFSDFITGGGIYQAGKEIARRIDKAA